MFVSISQNDNHRYPAASDGYLNCHVAWGGALKTNRSPRPPKHPSPLCNALLPGQITSQFMEIRIIHEFKCVTRSQFQLSWQIDLDRLLDRMTTDENPTACEGSLSMLRLMPLVVCVFVNSMGCSHLPASKQTPPPPIQDTRAQPKNAPPNNCIDHLSSEADQNHEGISEAIGTAAFTAVAVPVCFVWWVAHGCPDP